MTALVLWALACLAPAWAADVVVLQVAKDLEGQELEAAFLDELRLALVDHLIDAHAHDNGWAELSLPERVRIARGVGDEARAVVWIDSGPQSLIGALLVEDDPIQLLEVPKGALGPPQMALVVADRLTPASAQTVVELPPPAVPEEPRTRVFAGVDGLLGAGLAGRVGPVMAYGGQAAIEVQGGVLVGGARVGARGGQAADVRDSVLQVGLHAATMHALGRLAAGPELSLAVAQQRVEVPRAGDIAGVTRYAQLRLGAGGRARLQLAGSWHAMLAARLVVLPIRDQVTVPRLGLLYDSGRVEGVCTVGVHVEL
ncbi:MAG: hypothetical protein KTR31_17550 [Myxococcales bacterium]|nr:hypothetical protein [Myxococcales bacterium]